MIGPNGTPSDDDDDDDDDDCFRFSKHFENDWSKRDPQWWWWWWWWWWLFQTKYTFLKMIDSKWTISDDDDDDNYDDDDDDDDDCFRLS